MFNRAMTKGTLKAAAGAGSTRLGEGSHWQGEIHTGTGSLCVEGSMEGTIVSEGQVTIAPSGVVKGAIHAKSLTVQGRVEGVLKVEGCLEIQATGWVEGEIETGTLVVDQGGVMQGSCSRLQGPEAKEPVTFVPPRREERIPERPILPASGTHGPYDPIQSGRGPGWGKP